MKVSSFIILISVILCQSCFAQNKIADRKEVDTLKASTLQKNDQAAINTKPDTLEDSLQKRIDAFGQLKKPIKKDSADFEGLVLEMDNRIELLSKAYMSYKTIKGYKIQIFSGQSRWEASKVKSEFLSSYSKLPTPSLTYHAPNFKLRVGNYRNRFEAEKNLRLLKEKFPSAFLVKDEINIEYKD